MDIFVERQNENLRSAVTEGGSKKYRHTINPNTKLASVINQFLLLREKGLNCFEAANRHHDYVLRSTISDIQRLYGINFKRKREQVPNAFGKVTDCCRYWLDDDEYRKAFELIHGKS